MGDDEEVEVALTHTAKSKAFRYLQPYEIRQHVTNPDVVYYDPVRESYLIPVTREKHRANWNHSRAEKIVLIVKPLPDESTYLVITQTGDHYDWAEFEEVDDLPPVTGGVVDTE